MKTDPQVEACLRSRLPSKDKPNACVTSTSLSTPTFFPQQQTTSSLQADALHNMPLSDAAVSESSDEMSSDDMSSDEMFSDEMFSSTPTNFLALPRKLRLRIHHEAGLPGGRNYACGRYHICLNADIKSLF